MIASLIRQTMDDNTISNDELRNRLDRMEDHFKKLVNQQEIQGKGIEILDRDMKMFDEVLTKVQKLLEHMGVIEHILRTHTQYQQNASKDIQSELVGFKEKLADIPEEAKVIIAESMSKFIKSAEKRKISLVKPGFFGKIKWWNRKK